MSLTSYLGKRKAQQLSLSSNYLGQFRTLLPISDGGTGQTQFSARALVVAHALGSPLQSLPAGVGSSGQVLVSQGASEYPTWIDLATAGGIVGILGTPDQITASLAGGIATLALPQDIATSSAPTFDALTLSGLTPFSLVGIDASKQLTSLSSGSSNYWLQSNGSSAYPTWVNPATVAVTQIFGTTNQISTSAATGNVTLTLPQNIHTGASVTFASLTLTNPLSPSNGGTGLATYSVGDMLWASGTGTLAKFSGNTSASRRFLRQVGSAGVPTVPVWDSLTAADIPGSALTKTDDTNVTLTLGGTPATALLAAVSMTLGWTGQLGLTRGGTGSNLAATGGANQVLQQSSVGGAVTVAQLAANQLSNGTTGSGSVVLATSPTLVTPLLGTPTSGTLTNCTSLPIVAGTTGVLNEVRGGTNQSTYTLGDLLYGSGANTLAKLAGNILSSKRFLTQTGTGTVSAVPAWSAITASDIGSAAALSKADDTNVTLTLSGTPSTALLAATTITAGWTGQLGVARGGTGASSTVAYSVICGGTTTTGSLQSVATLGSSGQVLTSSGAAALPTWQSLPTITGQALTRTNDTNVTLTLGGTPASALLAATSMTLGWTGLLALSRGGTAADLTLTGGASRVLMQTSVGAAVTVAQLSASNLSNGTTGTGAVVLATSPALVTPALGTPSSGTLSACTGLPIVGGTTGTLSEVRGGTNQTSYVLGDLLYGSGANTLAKLAGNTVAARRFLRQTGTGTVSAIPVWDSLTAADVPGSALTKVDDTNVTLTLGGTPGTALLAAASITVGWSGLLGLARGGVNANLSATGGTSQVLMQTSVGAAITVAQLAASNLSNGTTGSGTVVLATSPTLVTPILGTPTSGTLSNCTGLPIVGGTTGTLTETRGGTNQTTYVLGDLLYGSGSNTLAKLAGNTVASRRFLRQTGTGTVSAIPVWDSLTAADIPGSALTKVDDTNVTLTLGGTPSTALLAAASITVGWTGLLGLARGGVNANLSATGGTSRVLMQTSVGAAITVAQLAASNLSNGTTGSGAVVLATSATLVTPLLGTPTSGTLTNCTGLPIVAGTTGTLSETRGGTNQTTYVLGDILFASAANVLSRLAGNTVASRRFLRQTGTGTVSAAPVWDSLTAADIPGSALTKVDDTNVTLTLGGTPATSLLAATSITVGWSGLLGLARGGVNANLSATGGTSRVLMQTSVGAAITVAQLAASNLSNGTTGSGTVVLATSPTLVTPLLGTPTSGTLTNCTGLPIVAGTTGTLSETRGGTNQTTYVLGDLLYGSGANTLTKLAGNTVASRRFLRQTGTGTVSAAPAWDSLTAADIPGSALTKTDDTNVTLTLGGTPATSLLAATSITAGWTGQLSVPRGGTGVASTTAYGVICGGTTTTGALQNAGAGTTGQILTSNGASALPSFQTLPVGQVVFGCRWGGSATINAVTNSPLGLQSAGSTLWDMYDPYSMYVGSTGVFTVPVTGKYLLQASVQWADQGHISGGVPSARCAALHFWDRTNSKILSAVEWKDLAFGNGTQYFRISNQANGFGSLTAGNTFDCRVYWDASFSTSIVNAVICIMRVA